MEKKNPSILLVFFISVLPIYGQYTISGYIQTKEKTKTIYLSLLRYHEESMIYPDQILFSTQTDSTGYFEFSGQLLSKENKLYRIHSNYNEESEGLQIYGDDENKNYHNFIFSNTDSLYFPKGEYTWFSQAQNSNSSDQEWRKSIQYELDLIGKYSETQNNEAINQAKESFLDQFKKYSRDSLSDPLVQLLAFEHIKTKVNRLDTDFDNNPDFYYDILEGLNQTYSGISYYEQFQEEMSRLENSRINERYLFHKRLNYVLGGIIALLLLAILWLFRKLKIAEYQNRNDPVISLTAQEKKIARLICDGRSNKEIASDLFISLSTVKSHIRNLYSKIEVSDRQQFIRKMKNHPPD